MAHWPVILICFAVGFAAASIKSDIAKLFKGNADND